MPNVRNVESKYTINFKDTAIVVYHADCKQGHAKHDHVYPHVTFCTAGRAIVRKEGFETVIDKNSPPILIKELEWHEVEAIEDGTVLINVHTALG